MHLFRVLLCTMLCTLASSYALHCQDATLQWKRQIHRDAIRKLDFSPSGKYIAVVSRDSVSVCETATGEVVARYIPRSRWKVDDVALDAVFAHGDTTLLIVYSPEAQHPSLHLLEWSFSTGEQVLRASIIDSSDYYYEGDHISADFVAQSEDGSVVAIGMGLGGWAPRKSATFGEVAVYNSAYEQLPIRPPIYESPICIRISSDGKQLFMTGEYYYSYYDPTIRPYSIRYTTMEVFSIKQDGLSSQHLDTTIISAAEHRQIALSPDNNLVAIASGLYDYHCNKLTSPLDLQASPSFLFLPDGNHILAALSSGPHSIGILNIHSNTWIAFFGERDSTTTIDVAPQPAAFAAGHNNGFVDMWEMSQELQQRLQTSAGIPLPDTGVSLLVSPNPSDGQNIHISFALSKPQQVDISIRDMMGTTVAQFQHNIQHAGTSTLTLPCSSGNIAAGVYICTVHSQDGMFSTPFLVLH